MKTNQTHVLILALLVASVAFLTSGVSAAGTGQRDRGETTTLPRHKLAPRGPVITHSDHTIQDDVEPSLHTIQDRDNDERRQPPPDGARPPQEPSGPNPGAMGPNLFEYEMATTLVGDITRDGRVNVRDLVVLLMSWGTCPGGDEPCPADLDEDGYVGVEDLMILMTAMRAE